LEEVDDVGRDADGENSAHDDGRAHQNDGDDFIRDSEQAFCFHKASLIESDGRVNLARPGINSARQTNRLDALIN